jgi:hypothetical protein
MPSGQSMSLGLAHEIIHHEHEGATARGNGSQGGATVGNATRTLLGTMKSIGFPILATIKQLESAAPKAQSLAKRKAGTYPIGAKCQLEFFAKNPLNIPLQSALARHAVCFLCRSYLAAGIDQSLRMGAEGMRASLVLDNDHPFVMRGLAYMTKDGAPIEFFAPAEGFLGEYAWYGRHFDDVDALGQLFPKWGAPTGSKGSILFASSLRNAIADPASIRGALLSILALPPLLLSSETAAEININGHSGHVSPPEWARAIGERPGPTSPSHYRQA